MRDVSGAHRKKAASWKLQVAVTFATVVAVVAGIFAVLGQDEQQASASSAALSDLATSTVPKTSTAPTTTSTTPAPPPPPPPTTQAPPPPPPLPPVVKELCSTVLKGAQPHVAMAGNMLEKMFPVTDVGGAEGRSGADDHTAGLALDFMTGDTELGTALANYVLNNQSWLGVSYVIYQQRYNDGSGWSTMEDRGSPTANHYDHVHVSFDPSGPLDLTC